jgi:FkbM family methyltransferase
MSAVRRLPPGRYQAPPSDGYDPPGTWATVEYGSSRWTMRVPPGDHIGGVLAHGTPYEAELLEMTEDLLRPGDLVVDVGANIGNHALFWAVHCGADIIAFEPNPAAMSYLEVNIEANDGARVVARSEALGSSSGTASVLPAEAGNLGACRVLEGDGPVAVVRLDAVVTRPVRLIKVDVEGAEPDVLAGSARVIERDSPFVIAECADEVACRAVESVLAQYGYLRQENNLAWTPTYLWTPPSV